MKEKAEGKAGHCSKQQFLKWSVAICPPTAPYFIMIIIDILLPTFLGIHNALVTNPSASQWFLFYLNSTYLLLYLITACLSD